METGYMDRQFIDAEMSALYSNEFTNSQVKENQYIIVRDKDGNAVDYFKYQKGVYSKVNYPIIENFYSGKIKPRNPFQHIAMDMLKDRSTPVKVIRGVYGSGKDFLMLNEALALVEKGDFQKIVFVRPNIGVANIPDIGALPGDAYDKLAWTLAPLYDKVGGEEGVQRLMEQQQLEMVPLPFIRGRSFENSIIYVCEGQNSTTEIAKLLISRVGEDSELWINGDCHQTDKRIFEKDNGITSMVEKLTGNSLFGYVYLPTTERSAVSRLADLLD